jgi:hypothetical protein
MPSSGAQNSLSALNRAWAFSIVGSIQMSRPQLLPQFDIEFAPRRTIAHQALHHYALRHLAYDSQLVGDLFECAYQAFHVLLGVGGGAGNAQQILRRGGTEHRVDVDALF